LFGTTWNHLKTLLLKKAPFLHPRPFDVKLFHLGLAFKAFVGQFLQPQSGSQTAMGITTWKGGSNAYAVCIAAFVASTLGLKT